MKPPIGNQSEPASQIGAQVTLAYIVRNMQNELNEYSMQQYKRIYQLVIDGVRMLRIYNQGAIQVAYLKINEAGIVKLPPDYIDYTKIGIPCHGQLLTLTVNPNMLLNRAQKCGVDIRTMYHDNGIALGGLLDGYFFAPHFLGSEWRGALYGVGGGFNTAYYRVDKVANQIQFDGIIPRGEIVLEYRSSGISVGTIVGAECIDPIKKYAHLYRVKYDDRVPMSTKQMLEDDLRIADRKLRAFNNKFTMSEYMDTLYRSHKQGPKP